LICLREKDGSAVQREEKKKGRDIAENEEGGGKGTISSCFGEVCRLGKSSKGGEKGRNKERMTKQEGKKKKGGGTRLFSA